MKISRRLKIGLMFFATLSAMLIAKILVFSGFWILSIPFWISFGFFMHCTLKETKR